MLGQKKNHDYLSIRTAFLYFILPSLRRSKTLISYGRYVPPAICPCQISEPSAIKLAPCLVALDDSDLLQDDVPQVRSHFRSLEWEFRKLCINIKYVHHYQTSELIATSGFHENCLTNAIMLCQVAPEAVADAGQDRGTARDRAEGCSCLYGNACVDEYVCLDWDNRLEVAKRNAQFCLHCTRVAMRENVHIFSIAVRLRIAAVFP